MRPFRPIWYSLLALVFLSCGGGGGGDAVTGPGPTPTPTPTPTVSSVTVSGSSSSVITGKTLQLTAQAKDANGNTMSKVFTWTSSSDAIATVGSEGLVKGIAVGSVTISATTDGKSGSIAIGILPIPVASVVVTLSTGSLTVAQTAQATAVSRDADGAVLADRSVTWSSSSSAVAGVSSSGVVTAVSPGTAIITATAEGKSGTASMTVVAALAAVSSITLSPTAGQLVLGQQGAFGITLKDASGNVLSGRTVSWSSSASSVASVASTGLITANAIGSTTITAASEGKTAAASLVVVAPAAPVATVTLTPPAAALPLGQSGYYTVILKDASGNLLTDRAITWNSSQPAIASVAADGLVSGLSAGTATITATSEGKSGSATVTVSSPSTPPTPVASIILIPTNAALYVGDYGQFEVTLRDASGNTLTGRVVTWSSSATSVAIVGSSGIVLGMSPGTTVITATSEGKSAVANLTVASRPAAPTDLCSIIAGASVVADDGKFLGSLTNKYNVNSVLNEYGSYGSAYSSTSIYNQYSQYGSPYASKSAYNPYTATPPRIFFANGTFMWLTVNTTKSPAVHPSFVKTCTNFP